MSSIPPSASSSSSSNPPAAAAAAGPQMAVGDANPLRGGCPVAAGRNKMASGCPVAKSGAAEPSASSASRSAASASAASSAASSASAAGLHPSGEVIPSNSIPAAGRGNSDDGRSWLNPSANQLFRALARKDKPIEAADAPAVASVHVAVTDNTWTGIMEYEKLHAKSCPNPTLTRFQGMDGVYSAKAKIMQNVWGLTPFDRHDWYVNRCGKEVKYVIDYYSFETPDAATGETSIDYFIDARPAPTMGGLYDRTRVAFAKWRRGEKIW